MTNLENLMAFCEQVNNALNPKTQETWKKTLAGIISRRLKEDGYRGYIKGLRLRMYETVENNNLEQAEILCMMLNYELEHFDELPYTDEPNKISILRLAIDSVVSLGEAGSKIALPGPEWTIGKIYDFFSASKKRSPEDRTADYSRLYRLGLKLYFLAENKGLFFDTVLKKIQKEIVEHSIKYKHLFLTFLFSPEIAEAVLRVYATTNPTEWNEYLDHIQGLVTYNKTKSFEFNPAYRPYSILEKLTPESQTTNSIAKHMKEVPWLKEQYDQHLRNKVAVEQERLRLQEEAQAREKSRKAQEAAAQFESREKKLKEQLEILLQFKLEDKSKNTILSQFTGWRPEHKSNVFENLDPASLRLWWYCDGNGSGRSYSLRHIITDLNEIARDPNFGKDLTSTVEKASKDYISQLYDITSELFPELVNLVANKFLELLKERDREKIESSINTFSLILEKYPEYYFLQSVVGAVINETKDQLEEVQLEWKDQDEKNQAKESVSELQREHLSETISKDISYLIALYGNHLGMDFEVERISVLSHTSHAFASTGTGMGMGLRINLNLSLERTAENHSYLNFEIGSDLKSIIRRKRMVNWIIPHEIAHQVDWKLNEPSDVRSRIQIRGKIPAEAWSMASECFIDGIGYVMARKLGISDPATRAESARHQKIVSAFLSTTKAILKTKLNNRRERLWYWCLLTRNYSVGKILQGKSSPSQSNKLGVILEELEKRIKKIDALPNKTFKIIVGLFQESFQGGQGVIENLM